MKGQHIRDNGDIAPTPPQQDIEAHLEIQAERAKRISIPTGSRWQYDRDMAYVEQTNKIPREDLTATQMRRFIESVARIGDYGLAYELSGEDIYKQIDKALRGKSKQCKCKGAVTTELVDGRPKQVRHSATFVKSKVYDMMQKRFVPLMQCNECYKLFI